MSAFFRGISRSVSRFYPSTPAPTPAPSPAFIWSRSGGVVKIKMAEVDGMNLDMDNLVFRGWLQGLSLLETYTSSSSPEVLDYLVYHLEKLYRMVVIL
uniref:Uncharacterized protein n=1 Tax=Amphimedon queenslandica TaxID=400682 RepID=A0A1X7SG51_AMPQE